MAMLPATTAHCTAMADRLRRLKEKSMFDGEEEEAEKEAEAEESGGVGDADAEGKREK